MRKYIFVIGIVIAFLFAFYAAPRIPYWLAPPKDPQFICYHPIYEDIFVGQGKDEIIALLGEPSRKRLRSDFDSSDSLDPRIQEEWKHALEGWHTFIWISLDEDGIVVKKGCGA